MPRPSPLAQSVPPSGIRRIFELAQTLDDVIALSVGEPEVAVAPHVLAAGADAWEQDVTNYTANSGIAPLRAALAAKLASFNGYTGGADHVHVTAGGSQALHLAMTLTLSPGDEILIPDPGYSTFAMAPRLVGAVPVPYTLTVADAFVPDVDRLDSLVSERTRVLLVNSPSNPLGVVYPPEVVDALVAFARRHDLWIISDEVYEYLTFGVPFTSVLAAAPERTVGVFSLSKTYALTGARVGYLVTPPPLTPLFGPANEAIVSCVNAPAQYAALAAVTGPQDAVEAARATYAANLAAARELLDARGIPYLRSDGAFYLWIDVSHASGGDVSSWAERFLVAERVAVAPGSAFGAAGEGWVRVCYAGRVEPLLTGLSRLPQP